MEDKSSLYDSKSKGFIMKTLFNTYMVVFVSILTKIVNLVCNIFLARLISKEAYGLTKVYFEFAFLLILYFPRETIRKTAQKFCPNQENEEVENNNFKETVQLNWVLNFIIFAFSIPLYFSFIIFSGNSLAEVKSHLFLYLFFANAELTIEPIIVYLNIKLENSKKLAAITIGNYVRVISSCIFAYFFGFDLWAFTLSRILASITYILYMLYIWRVQLKQSFNLILPNFGKIFWFIKSIKSRQHQKKTDNNHSEFNYELTETFFSFVKTNLLKMILTYTEKLILSFYLDLSEVGKGEYSFVVDNFNIIVKYFLEPIEESFFNLVNKLKSKDEDREKSDKIFNLLTLYLKFMMIFGILLVSYIFVVGKEVITLVFTSKWGTSTTEKILKCYSIYVAIISVNGIIEAYSNATYSNKKMNIYNSFMVLNSTLLVILSIFLGRYDMTGLIFANGITMMIRIVLNSYMLVDSSGNKLIDLLNFFKSFSIKIYTVLFTLAYLYLFTFVKENSFISKSLYLTVGFAGTIFVLNVLTIVLIEGRPYINLIRSRNI